MLTPFGKAVRKYRIDKGVRLKNMAEEIGVSSAFLSAIETGRKTAPMSLLEKIGIYFSLTEKELDKLIKLANESRSKVNLSLDQATRKQRELATVFSRKFNELSVEDVEKLMKVLIKE